jgi:hypothetical protein
MYAATTLFAVINVAIMVPSSTSLAYFGARAKRLNYRTSQQYSTMMDNFDLFTPGTKFNISPSDSFDFVPSVGYGDLREAKEQAEAFGSHVLMKDYDSVAEWSKTELGDALPVKVNVVPMPKESLPGKELTVKSAVEVLPKGNKVLCHQVEHDSYFCHKDSHVSITAIDVSTTRTNGEVKSSTLWVACHEDEHVDCHVMNVNDVIFTSSKDDSTESSTKVATFLGHENKKTNLKVRRVNYGQ